MDETQHDSNRKWSKLYTKVLGACAIGSMGMTFQGLMQSGKVSTAALLTGISGLIAFVIFAFLCHVLPGKPSKVQQRMGLGVALPGLLIVLSTSTTFGILGMAAPEAQRLEMRDAVDRADVYLEALVKRQKKQTEAITLLEARAAEFARLAEDEKKSGTFERRGTKGQAYRDLVALSEGFQTVADTLEADQKRRETAGKQAAQTLSSLRLMAESTPANMAAMREVSEPYTRQLRALSIALAELERSALDSDIVAPVRSVLSRRESTVPGRETAGARNGKGKGKEEARQKQQAAAESVTQIASAALEQVQEALAELQSEPGARERFTMPTPQEAVLRHLGAVSHLIALPLALDVGMPLVAFIALSFLQLQPHPQPNPGGGAKLKTPQEDREDSPIRAWPDLAKKVAGAKQQRAAGDR